MVPTTNHLDDTYGNPPMVGRCMHLDEFITYVQAYTFTGVAPDRIVLHHTVIPDTKQWRGLASMRGMQSYYAALGWTAAPHLFVAPDGIWMFTPLNDVGIHAGTGNAGYFGNTLAWYSIGVEMVGRYDTAVPTGPVWEQTVGVLGILCAKMNRKPEDAITFHRDYTNTKSCPGRAVTKTIVNWAVSDWLKTNVTVSEPEKDHWLVKVTADGLCIRQGPSTRYKIVDVLAKNTIVSVDSTKTEDSGMWLHLTDCRGFVKAQYTERLV